MKAASKSKTKNSKSNIAGGRGQVMVLATLALGGSLLGATVIAGFLMLRQLHQTSDLENSTRAIFAADAGIEWGFYQFFQVPSSSMTPTPYTETLANGAVVNVDCYGSNNAILSNCYNASYVQAIGVAADAKRAFRGNIQASTP